MLPSEESTGVGCLLLLFGGIFPALLYAEARSHRVQCDGCGYIFRQPNLPKTGVAKLATAILLVIIAAAATALVLICWPSLAADVPQPQMIQDLVLLMADQTGVFVVLVAATSVAIFFICLFAAAASSFAQRRRLSKEFEIRPKRWALAKAHHQPAGQASPEVAPSASPDEPSA